MNHFDADIRIIKRVISETFKGIQRTRWMNLIIITTMAAILSIFGCLFRTSIAISDFVDHLGDSLEVSVYLKPGYSVEKSKATIIKIGNVTNIATLIVLIVLGGLTLSIINNTIHLVIQSRSEEIEIMRMMGVGNWYIRAPYILQGAFYGFCGALISIIPLRILENYIISMTQFFNMGEPLVFTNIVIVVLMTMGLFVGSLGSFISVRKYLRI